MSSVTALVGEREGVARLPTNLARSVIHRLLARLSVDALTIEEAHDGAARTFRFAGTTSDDPIAAHAVVHDARAYSAIVSEGSIGLGRGYIEGWWSSPDPVAVVRLIARNMTTIDRWRNLRTTAVRPVTDTVRRLLPHATRRRNRDDISAHYDIGNDFFALFLDETMTYSSAVFEHDRVGLADASRYKYDLLLEKLGISDGQHLLEIGTGWGGMAIRAAQRIGCRVTTTTISAEQLREARQRVRDAGLTSHVTLLDADWRDLSGQYDHVVSIEMIEAVDWRDYDAYFTTIDSCLASGGRVAIQAICIPDDRWERTKNTEDFIKRFVFPNGCLPSVAAIGAAVNRSTTLRVVDVEDFGPHYAETLAEWRRRFWLRVGDVKALGLDDRFCRLWDFYLAYCEAGMRERSCTVVQIVLSR